MKRSVLIGFVLVGILLVWVIPRLSPLFSARLRRHRLLI